MTERATGSIDPGRLIIERPGAHEERFLHACGVQTTGVRPNPDTQAS